MQLGRKRPFIATSNPIVVTQCGSFPRRNWHPTRDQVAIAHFCANVHSTHITDFVERENLRWERGRDETQPTSKTKPDEELGDLM